MNRRSSSFEMMRSLALTVAVFMALLPAFGGVFASPLKNQVLQLCSAFDLIARAVDGDHAPEQDHTDPFRHCVFCTNRHFVLLSSPPVLQVPQLSFFDNPFFFKTQSSELFIRSDYQSRAPPALS